MPEPTRRTSTGDTSERKQAASDRSAASDKTGDRSQAPTDRRTPRPDDTTGQR